MDDSGATHADWVAHSYSSTVHVHLGHGDVEKLQVGKDSDREGFIELHEVDLRDREAGSFQDLLRCQVGGDTEIHGIKLGISVTNNSSQGGEVVGLNGFLRSQDDGGCTVVDLGSVGCSNGTRLVEDSLQ